MKIIYLHQHRQRKELAELRATFAKADTAANNERDRLDEHAAEQSARAEDLATLRMSQRDHRAQLRTVQRQHDDAELELNDVERTAHRNAVKCRSMDGDMQKLRTELSVAEAKVQRLQATARKFGERIATELSDADLARRLAIRERRIVEIENNHGETLEMVQQRLESSRTAANETDRLVSSLGKTLKMLTKARFERYRTLANLKQSMSLRVHQTFNVSIISWLWPT